MFGVLVLEGFGAEALGFRVCESRVHGLSVWIFGPTCRVGTDSCVDEGVGLGCGSTAIPTAASRSIETQTPKP